MLSPFKNWDYKTENSGIRKQEWIYADPDSKGKNQTKVSQVSYEKGNSKLLKKRHNPSYSNFSSSGCPNVNAHGRIKVVWVLKNKEEEYRILLTTGNKFDGLPSEKEENCLR